MQFTEERKWQRNEVTNWKLELFEYLRSSPFFPHKLYFDTNVTQPRILDLLDDADITISAGQLSNFLIKNHDGFHKEKDALY